MSFRTKIIRTSIRRKAPFIALTIALLSIVPKSTRGQDLGDGALIADEIMREVPRTAESGVSFVDRDTNEAFLVQRYGNGEIRESPFVGSYGPSGRYEQYKEIIAEAAKKYKLPIALIDAVIRTESGYRERAVSRTGAKGLMQLMPKTAKHVKVDDPFDPHQNILGGTRYLRQLYNQFGSIRLAVAAYNGGPGAIVNGGIHTAPGFRETRIYMPLVLSRYHASILDKTGAEELNGW